MLENLYYLRNMVSFADFLFKCVLENNIQTLLLGVWLRQLTTLAIVGTKVAKW